MTAVQPGIAPGTEGKAPARRKKPKWTFDNVSFFAVFLGLPLVLFLLFVVSPFAQAIYYSFTNWSGFNPAVEPVGLDNYARIFSDQVFMKALGNNILLAIVLPIVTIVLALILATLITVGGSSKGQVRGLKGSSFYRIVSFFPYAVPAIAIAILWGQIYQPNNGLLNGILTSLGLENFAGFNWLGNGNTAMGASIFVMVWSMVGFYMLLFIAAIKSIPAELYEAARIDGAGRVRMLFNVTLPLIRDNVQTAAIYIGIFALDAYVFMAALNPTGGPEYATEVMAQRLIDVGFGKGQFGIACAMGVVLALLTLAFAGLVALINKLTGGSKGSNLV